MLPALQIRDTVFDWGKQTYVMGIVNVTPDSFSGDGLAKGIGTNGYDPVREAVDQVGQFLQDGAHIIDVGGESTRPGGIVVAQEDEITRVIPVIKAIRQTYPAVIISVDTYKARVAEEALRAGADMINDVWGFLADPEMANVVSESKAPVVLIHNRSKPENAQILKNLGGRYIGVDYDDLLRDVMCELDVSIQKALKAGVANDKIIIDPGIGFGKTVEQNIRLVNELEYFKKLGKPILLGPSRKSFIGYTLGLPPQERVEGTAATIAIGIDRGADIIRVHDVKVMSRVAKMVDAITRHPQ